VEFAVLRRLHQHLNKGVPFAGIASVQRQDVGTATAAAVLASCLGVGSDKAIGVGGADVGAEEELDLCRGESRHGPKRYVSELAEWTSRGIGKVHADEWI